MRCTYPWKVAYYIFFLLLLMTVNSNWRNNCCYTEIGKSWSNSCVTSLISRYLWIKYIDASFWLRYFERRNWTGVWVLYIWNLKLLKYHCHLLVYLVFNTEYHFLHLISVSAIKIPWTLFLTENFTFAIH